MDAVLHRRRCFRRFPVIDLRPGHVVVLDELQQRGPLLRLVKTYAQHFKSLVVVLVVGGDQVGKFRPTWPAPRGPEIEQHHLALVIIGKIDRLVVNGLRMKRKGPFTDRNRRTAGTRVACAGHGKAKYEKGTRGDKKAAIPGFGDFHNSNITSGTGDSIPKAGSI